MMDMDMAKTLSSFMKNQNKQENPWDTAIFGDLYRLPNDTRGKFGEQVISKLIHYLNWDIQMDASDVNSHDDGHYDIKANNLRIEVKTACRGTNESWQHEPLYDNAINDVCDYIVFLDFSYDCYYLTVCKSMDLPLGGRSNPVMFGNKHGTLRKNKDDGYKFDFSRTTINTAIKAGVCKQFNADTELHEVAEWFNNMF